MKSKRIRVIIFCMVVVCVLGCLNVSALHKKYIEDNVDSVSSVSSETSISSMVVVCVLGCLNVSALHKKYIEDNVDSVSSVSSETSISSIQEGTTVGNVGSMKGVEVYKNKEDEKSTLQMINEENKVQNIKQEGNNENNISHYVKEDVNSCSNNSEVASITYTPQVLKRSTDISVGYSYTIYLPYSKYTVSTDNNCVFFWCNGNKLVMVGENPGETILTIEYSNGDIEIYDIFVDNSIDFDGTISSNNIPMYRKGDIIGYVTCSSVGLNRIPIYYDWSQDIIDTVDIAMGSWTSTVFGQGQGLFIGGHNCYALSNLKYAELGDTILIETTYGANYLYRIDYANVVSALVGSDGYFFGVADMYSGQYLQKAFEDSNTLGVVTCAEEYSYDYRFYVRAQLVKGTKIIQ